jgi:hypothetical protein
MCFSRTFLGLNPSQTINVMCLNNSFSLATRKSYIARPPRRFLSSSTSQETDDTPSCAHNKVRIRIRAPSFGSCGPQCMRQFRPRGGVLHHYHAPLRLPRRPARYQVAGSDPSRPRARRLHPSLVAYPAATSAASLAQVLHLSTRVRNSGRVRPSAVPQSCPSRRSQRPSRARKPGLSSSSSLSSALTPSSSSSTDGGKIFGSWSRDSRLLAA